MQRFPDALLRQADLGVQRAGDELARGMRREAPKAHSILTNSIQRTKLGQGIHAVVAGAHYAKPVDRGTGRGGFPPEQSLLDWIRVKKIQPNDPSMSQRDLAYVIARSIFRRGTPSQPFATETKEKMQPRIMQVIRGGVARGMRELRLQ